MSTLHSNYESEMYTIMDEVISKTSIEVLLSYFATKEIDVVFLLLLIEHHKSGIEMAQRANAEYPVIQNLASNIIVDQQKEIQYMEHLLQRLTTGRICKATLDRLRKVVKSDDALMMFHRDECVLDDVLFSVLMAEHHSTANQMSRIMLLAARDSKVKQLARHVIKAQSKERQIFVQFVNQHTTITKHECEANGH
jgi:uncharacterized protein (DUF305 family)